MPIFGCICGECKHEGKCDLEEEVLRLMRSNGADICVKECRDFERVTDR